MRDRVNDSLPRTNNSVEAWHRSFQQTEDCHHPSVYKLVDHFRKEQDHVEIMIERYRAGFRQPEASKYVRLNQRPADFVSYIRQRTIDRISVGNICVEYLRGISAGNICGEYLRGISAGNICAEYLRGISARNPT